MLSFGVQKHDLVLEITCICHTNGLTVTQPLAMWGNFSSRSKFYPFSPGLHESKVRGCFTAPGPFLASTEDVLKNG